MFIEVTKVLLSLFRSRSSQAFIVFYWPSRSTYLFFPFVEVRLRIEVQRIISFFAFYYRRDELFKKTVNLA